MNSKEPVKFYNQKLGGNHNHVVTSDNMVATFSELFEPALYISIDEGYCKNMFHDGTDKSTVVGLETVHICVEYDREVIAYFDHKNPRGDESTEKPDYTT